jgi:hypothetical protein
MASKMLTERDTNLYLYTGYAPQLYIYVLSYSQEGWIWQEQCSNTATARAANRVPTLCSLPINLSLLRKKRKF